MKSSFSTVSGKLLLATGLAISLIVLCYTAFSGWRTSERVHEQVMESATTEVQSAAAQVALTITEATAAATGLSGMISGYMEAGNANTRDLIAMLKAVPLEYENLFSSWMSGLNDGSTDAYLTGAEGRNEAGIFTPYWTKNAQGGLDFQTFPIEPSLPWYAKPLAKGKSVTTEPYLTQQGYLVTSVATPIKINGKIVGIAGVDITLQAMTEMISAMETFEGGRIMLVDDTGKWVAHPQSEQLTKPYEGVGASLLAEALADGQQRVIVDGTDGSTRIFYPFTTPTMNATWAVVLDVPEAIFTAPVHQEVLIATLGGILILTMALSTIYLSSTRMVRRPLAGMLAAVNGLAAGEYDTEVSGSDRRDEIGAMAGSVETLRLKLMERQELEAEQLRLRAEAEAEREARAHEDAARLTERETRIAQERTREERDAAEKFAAQAQEDALRAARDAEQAQVVSRLASGLRGLAGGALDVAIAEPFTGGYDQLRVDFNDTVARLADLLGAINATTENIVGAVEEITGATTDLSRQAETSAATLEETAAALNELTEAVQSAARSARRADDEVKSTSDKARMTTVVVKDTISAMATIQESSDKISKIINVIDDIAFQTNLLALNAGVEAARAGEAGRGFAVVASEVRALAQRASDAAREIDGLISSSGSQVTNGASLVHQAGEALQAIAESIEVISSHVGNIATSADEQAAGIGEINSAVNQLDRTQQNNAAAYEETAATCMALSDQAKGLERLVGTFQMSSATARRNAA